MATFTNRAQLTYNGVTTSSNTVTGEIAGVLSITKHALADTYSSGDSVTYIISLINQGDAALTGITVADDLGTFEGANGTLVPLTYEEGSAAVFEDGVLNPSSPTVSEGGLTFSGVNVPANGSTVIVYNASVNEFAPLDTGSEILNTAEASGFGSPVCAEASISVSEGPVLSISKSLTPLSVNENGAVTYTLTIENTGNAPADEGAKLVVSDSFDPVLTGLSASLNGTELAYVTDYTYDASTGVFETVPGVITVPAAKFTCSEDGAQIVSPGVAVLTISGRLG